MTKNLIMAKIIKESKNRCRKQKSNFETLIKNLTDSIIKQIKKDYKFN